MKRAIFGAILIAVAVAAGTGGFWIGGHRNNISVPKGGEAAAEATGTPTPPDRKILYYRDPMGKPFYAATPKKDTMGMDYLPVPEGEEDAPLSQTPSASPAPNPLEKAAQTAPKGAGKILYYRNPMGLPDTSPVPKKDSMGMDYIPVTAGEVADTGAVTVTPAKVQALGVRTEAVQMRKLVRPIRSVGSIQPDERRLHVVTTKFEGWIEKLRVNATGELVRRGEALMDVYSPDLVVAEQEYVLALHSLHDMAGAAPDARASARQLADAALARLRNWDISNDQVRRLERSGEVTRTMTLRAPTDGVVMEKMAVEGVRFMPGEPLYRIADLSTVWLIADVFEQDLALIRSGQEARVAIQAYPGKTFAGTVSFVYPTVNRETRTAKVRIEIPNPGQLLKADMYGTVEVAAAASDTPVPTVPESAVIDSGKRQVVLVESGEGRYQPQEVKLGRQADGYVEVLTGVGPNDKVVVGANFLIDAESNLRAALQSFTAPEGQTR